MIINLNPAEAWRYIQDNPASILVDVRTKLEYFYVGHPSGAVHIPWKEAPAWTVNPDFVSDVRKAAPEKDTPVLLLCRSGQRSLAAANALQDAGYTNLVNIDEGFEGPLDENKHRCTLGGWRFHGLPWEQS
ncbi:MAG: rhodanese-like domain-containing protein [Methylococcaceae bacterium]|nr:rhodanese-like domain-containing protein [Methylococcaceae bacterium]